MNISSSQAFSILGIVGSAVLTKSGMITLSFFLEQPVCYSLSPEDFENRNKDFFRAFRHMGSNTYIHKQDVYLRSGFDASVIPGNSFIQEAERNYFDGVDCLSHFCILSFSLAGLSSLETAYVKNPFLYKENLVKADLERLNSFIDEVERAIIIINSLPRTKATQLHADELQYLVYNYVNGFHNDSAVRDLYFDKELQIEEKRGVCFALCKSEYLPDYLETYVKDESLPMANVSLYAGMLDMLGVHLKHTHIINQIWHFDSAFKGELDFKVKQFGQHKNFDKSIAYEAEQLSQLQDELLQESNIICRTHFNVIILENDPKELNKAIEYVKNIFKVNDFNYYLPTRVNFYEIFRGSVIGVCNKMPDKFFFLSDLQSSLCLMLNFTTYKSDPKGIFFNERIYNSPQRIDLLHSPLGNKLPAINAIIMASTGAGKSVTMSNMVQQNIEEKVLQIIVEFGRSFYLMTLLYPDISLHVDYDGSMPLGINPFFVQPGTKPSIEKIKTLVNIVLKFWRSKETAEDAKQVVSLTKFIRQYYEDKPDSPSFPDFYNYVKENFYVLLSQLEIEEEYFDYKSFVHICSDFMPGGIYENVCKESTLGEQIHNKDFVVFELTNIKKDPFLVSVIISILLDTIETKLLDRSKKGLLIFDEYAESQTIKDSFDGSDIHQTVAFCYQKLRKENSGVYTILQSPAQLSNDQFSKSIISNTQILYVLPTTETVYDQVIETFHIKNENHINLMKSIRNNFNGVRPYSELFVRFLDLDAITLRLEISPEKFLAFQTDGETWQALYNDYLITGSLEQSIKNKLNKKKYEKVNSTISI